MPPPAGHLLARPEAMDARRCCCCRWAPRRRGLPWLSRRLLAVSLLLLGASEARRAVAHPSSVRPKGAAALGRQTDASRWR
jgi:hypothetical protein